MIHGGGSHCPWSIVGHAVLGSSRLEVEELEGKRGDKTHNLLFENAKKHSRHVMSPQSLIS